ncbi:MAG: SUMF1/EgtB/PvdO family nonheme iron enzyme [Saprospiraceae bacterium]|nr:SUMF1/EgtB/PvdO family nonheme iron enzyme [Saprospiraceae bacterium]
MKYLLLPISLAFLLSCSNQIAISLDNQTLEVPRPPMTVKLDNNLFMDETEISNINYREYLYWTKSIFGEESTNYTSALPDTLVWNNAILSYGEPYIATYFRHPAYNDYPVVGVSYEQAKKYAQWRSDRVFEQILILKKVIVPSTYTSENYFTIERYFKGEIQGVKPDVSIPYPAYRLSNSKPKWEKDDAQGFTKQRIWN